MVGSERSEAKKIQVDNVEEDLNKIKWKEMMINRKLKYILPLSTIYFNLLYKSLKQQLHSIKPGRTSCIYDKSPCTCNFSSSVTAIRKKRAYNRCNNKWAVWCALFKSILAITTSITFNIIKLYPFQRCFMPGYYTRLWTWLILLSPLLFITRVIIGN